MRIFRVYSTLLRWMGIVGDVVRDLVPSCTVLVPFIPLACKSTTFVVVIAKIRRRSLHR